MKRDLSRAQYHEQLRKIGMDPGSVIIDGYVNIGHADGNTRGGGLNVYGPNAGPRRRDQLRYLIRERQTWRNRFLELSNGLAAEFGLSHLPAPPAVDAFGKEVAL